MFKKRTQAPPVRRQRPAAPTRTNKNFSYYANRAPQEPVARGRQSNKVTIQLAQQSRRLVSRQKRLGALAGIVALLLIVVWNNRLGTAPNVVLPAKTDNQQILQDESVYAKAAEDQLSRSLANRSKLTIDSQKVSQQLLSQFPELAQADVALPLIGTKPRLILQPVQPAFIFVASDGVGYVLDATGTTVSTQIGDFSNLTSINDQSGLVTSDVGSKVLSVKDVQFIQAVGQQLQARDVSVQSYSLAARAQELEVRVAGQPYFIKFNLNGDALQQSGAYLAARQRLAGEAKQPAEYIDVRVGDRVYYK